MLGADLVDRGGRPVHADGEWKSVKREWIKKAGNDRTIRLVVATDAACEGPNLRTSGTLINVDPPWIPSRLEQRIGRIKRFGERRDRVDRLNLVYHGTIDERVYATLSERIRNRCDIFGTLPDVIDDDWIADIEQLDEALKDFTNRREKGRTNAFAPRYTTEVTPTDERREVCERVPARHGVIETSSRRWGERSLRPGA